MLMDVTHTKNPDGTHELRLRDTVATVQPSPLRHKAAVAALHSGEDPEKAAALHDAWTYTTGHGETYSHPTESGALHMAHKWFVEAGIVLVPFDHRHMNTADRGRAHDLQTVRDKFAGPRCGDFVQLPGQVRPVTRICGFGYDGKSFALSPGGSWSLPADAAHLGPNWSGYSGGLDWRPEYRLADLVGTGRHEMGRFWFFSGGRMAAGGGVDVALPCRVFTLKGAA